MKIHDPLALAAQFAVAVADDDDATVASVLARLDRRGLYELAHTLASHIDLEKPLRRTQGTRPDLQVIAREVARFYDLPADALLARGRSPRVSQARSTMYRVARLAGWSTPAIGAFVGRDHTTVVTCSRRVAADERRNDEAVTIWRHAIRAQRTIWDVEAVA